MQLFKKSACVLTLLLSHAALRADVQCASVFGSHMVLQRDMRLPVWGTAAPGEDVTVRVGVQEKSVKADAEGKWAVKLEPLHVGNAVTLEVAGRNAQKFEDILVGDVWICSGQSNMGFAVRNAKDAAKDIAAAEFPNIRLFSVAHKTSETPLASVDGNWELCTPTTVPNFTAVGFFFGRDLYKAIDVPIGLIHTSWGGTVAEAWTDRPSLQSNPDLAPIVEKGRSYAAEYPKLMEKYDQQAAALKAKGDTEHLKKLRKPAPPENNPNLPSVLFNAMIAPLEPLAIKGAVWYQGESNASRGYEYRTLLPAMINGWRKTWGEGDFPFLLVQLPEYGKNLADGDSGWAELREAQWLTARDVPHVGIAVAMGLGDPANVHPLLKQEVGRRLSLVAQRQVYGRDVVDSGPVYQSMKIEGDKVVLSFKVPGGQLELREGELEGFTVAGDDRKFVPAKGSVVDDTVIVAAPGVSHPVAVRYGWANSPHCSLYNKAGLPAAPFRTDDWPLSSANTK